MNQQTINDIQKRLISSQLIKQLSLVSAQMKLSSEYFIQQTGDSSHMAAVEVLSGSSDSLINIIGAMSAPEANHYEQTKSRALECLLYELENSDDTDNAWDYSGWLRAELDAIHKKGVESQADKIAYVKASIASLNK